MSIQQQQRSSSASKSDPSLIEEWYANTKALALDTLWVCGSPAARAVSNENEDIAVEDHQELQDTETETQERTRAYFCVKKYCASTPFPLSVSPVTGGYVKEHRDEEDGENSIREPISTRDLFNCPSSFSSQHHTREYEHEREPSCDAIFEVSSFSKYSEGPRPSSPADTCSTVSLIEDEKDELLESGSMEAVPTQDDDVSLCFRSEQRQPTKECPLMPTDEQEHQANGFTLQMRPHNFQSPMFDEESYALTLMMSMRELKQRY